MSPGDRVIVRRQPATVVAHGPCGWPSCPNGDDCVTVREDRWSTTTNFPAAVVEPV